MEKSQSFISIIIVDRHQLIQEAICSSLADTEDICLTAVVATEEALEKALSTLPDVLLISPNLHSSKPFLALLAQLHQRLKATTQIVALLAECDEVCVQKLVKCGVAGCILKDQSSQVVQTAVRAVARGGTWFSQPVTQALVEKQKRRRHLPHFSLNIREITLLQGLAAGQANRTIARTMSLSERTIYNQLQIIYEKLGVQSRTAAVYQATKQGLI